MENIPTLLIEAAVTIFAAVFAGVFVFYLGRESKKKEVFQKEKNSPGLEKIYPNFNNREFRKLMSEPGQKIIVNTWLFGLDIMGLWLKKALASEETTIEFVILEIDSEFASQRSKELSVNVENVMDTNREFLVDFIGTLSDSQKTRVKVFSYNSNPKFTIYSSGEKAFAGLFWPKTHALQGPQFLINGKDGYFSGLVWKYYEELVKIDITEDIKLLCDEANTA